MLLCNMKQIALVANYDTPDFDFPGLDISAGRLAFHAQSSTLTNSRWHIVSDGLDVVIDFGPGGNAICVDANGVGTLVSWAESRDNHFVVQWDQGLCGRHVSETLFGVYHGDQGSGLFYNSTASLEGFSMTKK